MESSTVSALKVLLVDDEANILSGYRRNLRGFNVVTAESAISALSMLASDPDIAVVASDFHMPVMDGVKFISQARVDFPNCVYLMITGDEDQATAVSAINDLGIFRFINKPCKAELLRQSIEAALAHYEILNSERKLVIESREQISELNYEIDRRKNHDSLTGLGNRLSFLEEIKQHINEGSLVGSAVACLDIDHFRLLNDGHGALAGDELLRETAALIRARLGDADRVARLSADTFVMLLEAREPKVLETLARDLQLAFCENGFEWNGNHIEVGCTLGLVHLSGNHFDAESLLRLAEVGKSLARESDKGLFVANSDDIDLESHYEESRMVAYVRRALSENQFELYQQKIIPSDPAELGVHIEVLIRLKDASGQHISPANFIPLAERFRLSSSIDQWVINGVARWFGENPGVLKFVSLCSINLSTSSLRDLALVDEIRRRFEDAWVEPSRICFEITETSAMQDVEKSVRFIEALREHGFKVAIDDFGTGYSSFAYLRTLPVDYLKIDGTFISKLDQNPVDKVITSSINDIAHVLGKKTIAEYVENQAIADELVNMGVDYLQGFHVATPQPLLLLTSELMKARQVTS